MFNLMIAQLFMQALQEVPTLIDDTKSMISAIANGRGGITKIENAAKAFSLLADHASTAISNAGSSFTSPAPAPAAAMVAAVNHPAAVVAAVPPSQSGSQPGDQTDYDPSPDSQDDIIPGLDQAPPVLPAGTLSATVPSPPAAVVAPPGNQTLAPAGVDPSRWAAFQAWQAANPLPVQPSSDPTDTRNVADKTGPVL